MVLEGTFLFTVNGFRELKRLRWLVWLTIHDYLTISGMESLLSLWISSEGRWSFCCSCCGCCGCCSLSSGLQKFFLFGPRHFQLFTKDNHKIIRWLWTVTKTVAYYITKKSNKIFSAYSWFQISAYVNCDGCLLRQSLLVHVYFYFSFLRKRTRPWYILSNFTQTLSFCLFERRWESW